MTRETPNRARWSYDDKVEPQTLESRVKVVHEGETVDADELEFVVVGEPPMEYKLSDGTRIEIRHEVKKVYRLCDKKKEDGSPIYLITGGAKVLTTPAEKVKA